MTNRIRVEEKATGSYWAAVETPGGLVTAAGTARWEVLERLAEKLAEKLAEAPEHGVPIPMILTCPVCHGRHVDKARFATHPHRDHQCESCGITWRPATVNTVGVERLYPLEEGERDPLLDFAALAARREPLEVRPTHPSLLQNDVERLTRERDELKTRVSDLEGRLLVIGAEEQKPDKNHRIAHELEGEHMACMDPYCCACECRACKRAWFAKGRPTPKDCPDHAAGAKS
jgi:predicted RNase H-like HicB family nuclease